MGARVLSHGDILFPQSWFYDFRAPPNSVLLNTSHEQQMGNRNSKCIVPITRAHPVYPRIPPPWGPMAREKSRHLQNMVAAITPPREVYLATTMERTETLA